MFMFHILTENMGLHVIGGRYSGGEPLTGPPGECRPGAERGAYVAAIFPGGIADQLHGELAVGQYSACQLSVSTGCVNYFSAQYVSAVGQHSTY